MKDITVIRKNITFKDLEGNSRTEEFCFHLNKAELAELKMVHGDGLEGLMGTLNAAKDGETIIAAFRKIISATVGQPNPHDGISFDKDPDYVKRFMNSDAYSELFMELISAEDSGGSFIIGVLPKDLQEEALKQKAAQAAAGPPAWITENREPTKAEMNDMTKDQLVQLMQRRAAGN